MYIGVLIKPARFVKVVKGGIEGAAVTCFDIYSIHLNSRIDLANALQYSLLTCGTAGKWLHWLCLDRKIRPELL